MDLRKYQKRMDLKQKYRERMDLRQILRKNGVEANIEKEWT